jgi:sugar lactone lactonase YvrE
MTYDDQGHLYVATKLGIQICDQPGRVVGIIRKPGDEDLSNVVFGGPALDTLYCHRRQQGLAARSPAQGRIPLAARTPAASAAINL